jgi:hypothetical protein
LYYYNHAFQDTAAVVEDLRPKSSTERQQLSIINALATVIVMDHTYIIATVASHHGGELEILACEQPN